MSQKIRWGILSTGTIAHNFAQTIAQMDENREIAAVASRTLEKARTFADQYGIPKAYGSYEELVSDPEIDIIYIATPHSEHASNMKLCLEHGKHVLCEKPFTVNADEAVEIFDLAKQKNLFIMEAFWTKFIPVYRDMERVIASGEIGELRFLSAQYGYSAPPERAVRKFDPALAGGALLDIGVYTLGFAAMFLGYFPQRILSALSKNDVGTDHLASVLLEYENGQTAQLTSAIQTTMPVWGEVFGSAGRIEVENFKNPQSIRVFPNGKDPYIIERPFEVNGFEYEIYEAENCVKNGEQQSKIMTPENTIAVMHMMDQVRRDNRMFYPTEK
mgnify:FL=1